jgi:chorismate synthase
MLRFLTAGESHGRALVAILEGLPAGLELTAEDIDHELRRRQKGYGRGGRMKIESDHADILSGVRLGMTLGSPLALLIENRDWENWQQQMSQEKPVSPPTRVTRPRPGHADLAGSLKYGHEDIRNVLERASARETAARTAVGAVAKRLLGEFGIAVGSHVIQIGPITADVSEMSWSTAQERAAESAVGCADPQAEKAMMAEIDRARSAGDTLGGVCEIRATGCPPGLGSHVHWDRRLDARLATAVMSIPGVKGVEIGLGFAAAGRPGSATQDEIFYDGRRFTRRTNRAGGIEGGISNGQEIVLRAAMKSLPTLGRPLDTVDVETKKPSPAARERSDVCAVPAMGVIAEAVVAFEIARALCEKLGGDSLTEMRRNFKGYLTQVGRT